MKKIKKIINTLTYYDNIYDGKISSLIIVFLSILAIGCFVIASILFKMEG